MADRMVPTILAAGGIAFLTAGLACATIAPIIPLDCGPTIIVGALLLAAAILLFVFVGK